MHNKLIIVIITTILLFTGVSYALRISKPKTITKLDDSAITILNEALEQIWNVTNGRYNLNITTTNPDGNVIGNVGDMILLNSSGTYYLEINTTGAKVWRGILLQDLP